jgi:hypothetical protein
MELETTAWKIKFAKLDSMCITQTYRVRPRNSWLAPMKIGWNTKLIDIVWTVFFRENSRVVIVHVARGFT